MRSLVFIICFLFASTLFAQCPGGTCQRPVKATAKTVTKVVQKTVRNEPIRKVWRIRLFRRGR